MVVRLARLGESLSTSGGAKSPSSIGGLDDLGMWIVREGPRGRDLISD
jgi:hypothetical protein